ncbi:MAG: MinD/ParA family protein [Pirellulales bacterium]
MHDQADKLREMVHRQGRSSPGAGDAPRLIAVASGGAGAGATTVAVNLAVGLALAGRRTVLVDVDLQRPGIAAGCRLDTRYSVADVLAGRRTLHEVLERGPGGIQVVTGPHAATRGFDASAGALRGLLAELSQLGAHADLVVLDIGAGIGRAVQAFWQAADWLLAVSTPELGSLLDTFALIKLFAASRGDKPVASLINRAPSAEAARDASERLARTCRGHLGLRLVSAGWLPIDAQLADAPGGWPFRLEAVDSEASRELDRVIESWSLDSAPPSTAAGQPAATVAEPTTPERGGLPAGTVPAPHLDTFGSLGTSLPPGASVG